MQQKQLLRIALGAKLLFPPLTRGPALSLQVGFVASFASKLADTTSSEIGKVLVAQGHPGLQLLHFMSSTPTIMSSIAQQQFRELEGA